MKREMSGFILKYSGMIEELRARGAYYIHEKTGAELFYIAADDDNKVFSVGFSTVPSDDTGVAHITEHCVLCGSEKYPLKELFMTLDKYSLNTYLNAMTYPDKTLYPLASQNSQDFMNLITVYMDAIFHPTMYRDELFFRQEGHGFDFEQGEAGVPSGVVYNEMKGATASPISQLSMKADKALFGNTYRYHSGGDPEAVLQLRYEDFLSFHKEHYYPGNARFYIYGNAEMERVCALLDEVISPFPHRAAVPEPNHVCDAGSARYVSDVFSSAEETAYATMDFVIGSYYDPVRNYAAEILVETLFHQNASPVKKALIESGLCTDLYGEVDTARASVVISLTFTGLTEFDPRELERRVFAELEKVEEGVLTRSLHATWNRFAFQMREYDSGSKPQGMLPMYLLLLHTKKCDDPFHALRFEKYLKAVGEKMESGEHMGWIADFMTENRHRVTVVLTPEDEETVRTSDEHWDSLTAEEKRSEREWYERLRKRQDSPDSEEALAALPKITKDDVEKERKVKEASVETLSVRVGGRTEEYRHLYFALNKSVMYVKLYFPIRLRSFDEISLFSVAMALLGNCDTTTRSLEDLSYEILLNAGDLKSSLEFFESEMYLTVILKTLPEKLKYNLSLIREVLFETKGYDAKRFAEIRAQIFKKLQLALISSGDVFASDRIMAETSEESRNYYYSSGIGLLQWLKKVEDIPASLLAECGDRLIKSQLSREGLVVAMAGDADARIALKEAMEEWICTLPQCESYGGDGSACGEGCVSGERDAVKGGCTDEKTENRRRREDLPIAPATWESGNFAYVIPADIQFVAAGGFYRELPGAFYVLRSLLGTEYLWQEVRMKGGAYGAGISLRKRGNFVFSSYRDPNLERTLNVFRSAADFVRDNTQYLDAAILSEISRFDHPVSAVSEAFDAFDLYFMKRSASDLRKQRAEILSATPEELLEAAERMKQCMERGSYCAVGNAEEIEKVKHIFDGVETC